MGVRNVSGSTSVVEESSLGSFCRSQRWQMRNVSSMGNPEPRRLTKPTDSCGRHWRISCIGLHFTVNDDVRRRWWSLKWSTPSGKAVNTVSSHWGRASCMCSGCGDEVGVSAERDCPASQLGTSMISLLIMLSASIANTESAESGGPGSEAE